MLVALYSTDCADFCNSSKRLFVIGVGFFLQTSFDFSPVIIFLLSYGGMKIAILADLEQISRDVFRLFIA